MKIACPNKSGVLYKELLKLNNNDEDSTTYAHDVITELQDSGLMSLKRYKKPNGEFVYTIPKTITEKSLAENVKGKDTIYEIDKAKYNQLKDIVNKQNISFINPVISKSGDAIFVNITSVKNNKIDRLDFFLGDEALYEQELAEDRELTVNRIQEEINIKPGVQELFDSNPELANAVYEALGFETELPSYDNIIETNNKKDKKERLKQRRERVLREINAIEQLIKTNPDEITIYQASFYEYDHQITEYFDKDNWEKSDYEYKTSKVFKKPSYLHKHLEEKLQHRIKNLQVINSSLFDDVEKVNYSNIFKEGKSYSSVEILKYISNNKKDALSSIAEKLLKYSEKNNVEVSILEKGEKKGIAGSYFSIKNKIEIYDKQNVTSHTLIHEIVHSLSVIDIDLNPNSKQVKSLENILKNILDKKILKEYENFKSSYEDYATKNIKELLSEIISRPDILAHLALYDTNYNLIKDAYKKETLLDQIVKILSDIFNFTKREAETLGDLILLNAVEIFENSKTKSNYESNQITPQQKQQALQQYSQYLDSIFPNSKVKDIVYHGTKAEFDKFDKSKIGSGTDFGEFGQGFYFTPKMSAYYKEAYGAGMPVLLNSKNILKGNNGLVEKLFGKSIESIQKEFGEIDTTERLREDDTTFEYVVFEPEQIHILGNKQDIEGFKEFVEKTPTQTTDNFNQEDTQIINNLINEGEIKTKCN